MAGKRKASGGREIDRLREQVKARQRAVGNKISTIKGKTGAVVAGTEYDPRRKGANLARMNSRQLNAYLNRLDAFMGRKVQFVPGEGDKPLPRAKWDEYKRLETRRNEQRRAAVQGIADQPAHYGGTETVGERAARLARTPAGVDRAVDEGPRSRISRGIRGEAALDVLIKRLERDTNPKGRRDILRRKRETVDKWLSVIDDPELSRRVRALSDAKFDFLFSHTNFADDMSGAYHARASFLEDGEEMTDTDFVSNKVEIGYHFLDMIGG